MSKKLTAATKALAPDSGKLAEPDKRRHPTSPPHGKLSLNGAACRIAVRWMLAIEDAKVILERALREHRLAAFFRPHAPNLRTDLALDVEDMAIDWTSGSVQHCLAPPPPEEDLSGTSGHSEVFISERTLEDWIKLNSPAVCSPRLPGYLTEGQTHAWLYWRDPELVTRVGPHGDTTFRRLVMRRVVYTSAPGAAKFYLRLASPLQSPREAVRNFADLLAELYTRCASGEIEAYGRLNDMELKLIRAAEFAGGKRPEGWTDICYEWALLRRVFPPLLSPADNEGGNTADGPDRETGRTAITPLPTDIRAIEPIKASGAKAERMVGNDGEDASQRFDQETAAASLSTPVVNPVLESSDKKKQRFFEWGEDEKKKHGSFPPMQPSDSGRDCVRKWAARNAVARARAEGWAKDFGWARGRGRPSNK